MTSLPLFSPSSSFMPQSSGSFRPLPAVPDPTKKSRDALPPRLPVMRSLFDPMPAPPPNAMPAAPRVSLPLSRPAVPITAPPSTVERTEAALREAGLAGQFWRGDALSSSPLPSTPSGFRALDEELPGGGWPSRCLTELLLSHTGVGEIRFLASTLSSLTQAGREIVLLAPPHVPDPTGWEQLGIDMRRVLIVRTERPADRLWAIEQSLRSSAFGALVAWLPEEKTLARHDALRRLQSVAAASNGLTFLMRPAAAQDHASPAPLRLTLSTGKPEGTRRTLAVRLVKRRGSVLAAPLTLLLPEVHRGLKAFSLAVAEPSKKTSSTASSPSTPSVTSGAPFPLVSHALAGSLLSDVAA